MKNRKDSIKKISGTETLYSTYELGQLKIKKLLFELAGISNYLMQDHEDESDKTDTQKLWKILTETIDFLMEFVTTIYPFEWNELKYTDRELEILKAKKEIEIEDKGGKK